MGLDGKRDREDEPEWLVRVDPREEAREDTPHDESVDAGGEGLAGSVPAALGTSTIGSAAGAVVLARLLLSVTSLFPTAPT
jgi:hypothetical protein